MRLVIIVLLGLSLTLALVGAITNRWYQNSYNQFHEGLWVSCQKVSANSSSSANKPVNCSKQPYIKSQGLAISGIVLLSIAFVLSIIYFNRANDRLLAYFMIVILLGSTLLLIFSYLLYPRNVNLRQLGYSIYFMLISSLIVLVTTGLVAFTTRTIQSTSTATYLI